MATERAAAIRRPGDSEGESAAATDLKAAEERLPRPGGRSALTRTLRAGRNSGFWRLQARRMPSPAGGGVTESRVGVCRARAGAPAIETWRTHE
jgi:hypothetical protein